MYDLDFDEKTTKIDEQLIELLKREGYLQSSPACPGPTYYYGRTRGGPGWLEETFPDLYYVTIDVEGEPRYERRADGTFLCTAHGPLHEIRRRAAEARPPALALVWPGIPLALLALLIGLAAWMRAMFRRRSDVAREGLG